MRAILVLAMLTFAAPAHAVEPGEMLADPVQESRARDLSAELRCLVCQNQSIDDSDAPLAKDLRVLLRERIAAGDSDAEVVSYLVDRYGEFVLLRPRLTPSTLLLWSTPLLVLVGIGGVFLARRGRSRRADPDLDEDEERALSEILSRES